MMIRDIMHKGVASVGPDTAVQQVARKMRDMDIGALPVVERGDIVGIVTDRDITMRAVATGLDISTLAARDVMSRDVLCCRATDDAHRALKMMETAQVRRLPVLDEGHELVGMVSLGDIVHARRPDLIEEVMKAVAAHRP
jgi:CBS domain-containing protein